jgi:hypothetical protein
VLGRAHEGLDRHSYLNAHGELSDLHAARAQGAYLSITDVWSCSAQARHDMWRGKGSTKERDNYPSVGGVTTGMRALR